MNNEVVADLLEQCQEEIVRIKMEIEPLNPFDQTVDYITKYLVVRICGTIETAFKTIVADKCVFEANDQVKNFIEKKVRQSSNNPSLENMYTLLNEFDEQWKNKFKKKMKKHENFEQLKQSLQSLNDIRNEFAHGGNPSITFNNAQIYFNNARTVIKILDSVIK